MTQKLTVALTETEMQALKKSAALDCRRPQDQARFLLRTILLGNQQTNQQDNQQSDYQQQLAATIRRILETDR